MATKTEIRKWLITDGRATAKVLFTLSEVENMGITQLSRFLGRDIKNVWRILKKMEIDGLVKNSNRKWFITYRGCVHIEKQKIAGRIPRLDR